MITVGEVERILCTLAPLELAESWDNCGLLVGRRERKVERIMVALDLTEEVLKEAEKKHCELIVTHHPLYFNPPKKINDEENIGEWILTLAEKKIALICLHTCLDAAEGGVNDALAKELGLIQVEKLEGMHEYSGMGRIGLLPKSLTAKQFADQVKTALYIDAVKLVCGKEPIQKVAVLGGSGGDALSLAVDAGADALVTGDVKHHVFLDAKRQGITLIDAGHFHTENPVCKVLEQFLTKSFPELEVFRTTVLDQVIVSC